VPSPLAPGPLSGLFLPGAASRGTRHSSPTQSPAVLYDVQLRPFMPKENLQQQQQQHPEWTAGVLWGGDGDGWGGGGGAGGAVGYAEEGGLGVCTATGIIKYQPCARRKSRSSGTGSGVHLASATGVGFSLPKRKDGRDVEKADGGGRREEESGGDMVGGSQFGMMWGSFEDKYYCT
jgi:hypothetical protein